MTDTAEPIEPIDPAQVFPWPTAGGSYRADPLTGELTRIHDTESQAPSEE